MTSKTLEQIEAMKTQTFGVEVEMNNITREDAAKLAAEYFGDPTKYCYTAPTDGYGTWSAWDSESRKWKFSRDVSIAGIESQQCEMVTPILTYKDMELLQGLIRALRKAGAKSNAQRGCGVHIHIGADGHTAQSLRNLVNIMNSHERLIAKAINIEAHRMAQYCKMVDPAFLKEINKKKPRSMDEVANIWYVSQGCDYQRTAHYNPSRYHMLNLHATFTKGTIEFRLFQFDMPCGHYKGGLHAGELKAYIQLCLALSEMAKEVKFASAKPQQAENQKFAMRTWLNRLGFIGDEFKTAREVFTRHLDGNSAFRFGTVQAGH